MEGQVRKPERKCQLLRRDPERLQPECGEDKAREGSERKCDATREERVPGRNEAEQADRQPAGDDGQRARQWRCDHYLDAALSSQAGNSRSPACAMMYSRISWRTTCDGV